MALSNIAIRSAKPGPSGLYVMVTPAGGKLWRLKFRVDGEERKLALGRYPDIGLAEAQAPRRGARAGRIGQRSRARETAHVDLR